MSEIKFFTTQLVSVDYNKQNVTLDKKDKTAIVLATIIGLPLLGIGALFTCLGMSYFLRQKAVAHLKELDTVQQRTVQVYSQTHPSFQDTKPTAHPTKDSDSVDQTPKTVLLNSPTLREQLAERRVFLHYNEKTVDPIEIEQKVLNNLPSGAYYSVHLTTPRLYEQIYKDRFNQFIQENPSGVILAFIHLKNPALHYQYASLEYKTADGQKIPVCPLFYPMIDENLEHNLQVLKSIQLRDKGL